MMAKLNVNCASGSVSTKKEENPIGLYFAEYHNGQSRGLRVKGFFALKLTNQKGDFDKITLRKEKILDF